MRDGENGKGFYGRVRINEAAPSDASRPTPMSRNVGIGSEMRPGLLSMTPLNPDPHGAGPRSNEVRRPSPHRPKNDQREPTPLHDPNAHPYRADPYKKKKNTYGHVPFERGK